MHSDSCEICAKDEHCPSFGQYCHAHELHADEIPDHHVDSYAFECRDLPISPTNVCPETAITLKPSLNIITNLYEAQIQFEDYVIANDMEIENKGNNGEISTNKKV